MRIGVVYPQTEFSPDPEAIRDYAQTAEGLGFTHILAYDHVLGASADHPNAANMSYTIENPFHEPLTLFGFMAGFTQKLEFASGVIILPQRQTALFARQAATLDRLCEGRLRLGIGIGWNDVEYTALNENFHNRGKRIEEQVEVLRLLWTQPLVNFRGSWHTIENAGLNPPPLQQPIPLWFGGSAEPALRRAARLGDGWIASTRQPAALAAALESLYSALNEFQRPIEQFGLEVRIGYGNGEQELWSRQVAEWKARGATHLSFNTMDAGLDTPAKHMRAIRDFARSAGLTAA